MGAGGQALKWTNIILRGDDQIFKNALYTGVPKDASFFNVLAFHNLYSVLSDVTLYVQLNVIIFSVLLHSYTNFCDIT